MSFKTIIICKKNLQFLLNITEIKSVYLHENKYSFNTYQCGRITDF